MAAIGQANPNPFPIHGALWFDARDFGMSPSNPDNAPALQAAHDAAVAALAAYRNGQTPLATVFIPAAKGAYNFKGPVFLDGSNIRILGEGKASAHGTTLAKLATYASPLFMVGLPRTAGGVVPNATYRPDLWNGGSPKLDSSVVTAAGQKWGLRTNGDLVAMSHGSGLTHGGFSNIYGNQPDYWQETDYLTFEIALEGFASGQVPPAAIACWNGVLGAVPLAFGSNGSGNYTVTVGYQMTKFGPISDTTYSFSSGPVTGVVRITIQVDLINLAVTAWVNGTQVAVTGTPPPAGARFPEPGSAEGHNLTPFLMNAEYSSGSNTGTDFAVYGMSVSKTLKYANKGVGTAQTPNPQIDPQGNLNLAGAPTGGTFTITYGGQTTAPIAYNATAATIQAALQALPSIGSGGVTVATNSFEGSYFRLTNSSGRPLAGTPAMCNGAGLTGSTVGDAYRYFPFMVEHGPVSYVDPWDIAHFLFTENPSTGTRHLSVTGNAPANSRLSSVFLLNGQTMSALTSSAVYLEGLQIVADLGYGTGIMRAHVLDLYYDECAISGGLWGVADFLYGANYVNHFSNCQIVGSDAALAMYWSVLELDTVTFANNGRWTLRLVGSNIDCRHVFITATSSPQYGFCRITDGSYGGNYFFDDITIDNEGVDYSLACFYAERHAYASVILDVKNSYLGLPGSCDLFQLKDKANSSAYPMAQLRAQFIEADVYGSLVSVDGPGWQFDVSHVGVDGGSDVTNLATFPGAPGGKVESTLKLPLRYGQSWAGCSRARNPGPSDGQFVELVPATSGTWGSSTPARWIGTAALQSDPTSTLAAYMHDHTSYGATVSGQAAAFGYTTSVLASPAMANTLFGSTIAGTSTVLNLYGAGLGGTFTLSYGGQTTAPIAYNATAATIQSALQGLSSVGSGNMTVSGGAGGPWTISLAGSLSRLAGGILGLTVNGANLTATGGRAVLGSNNTIWLYGAGLGGTYTLSYNGATTAPIPYNATAAQLTSAIGALNTGFSAFVIFMGGPGGPFQSNQGFNSINGAGLTATGGVAVLNPVGVPSTWYVALLDYQSRKRNYPVGENFTSGVPVQPATGCYRLPIPNSLAGFTAASAGAKSNVSALTFPAAVTAYTVAGVALFDAPVGGNIWATIQLARPIAVPVGATPTIAAGALTIANVPSLGSFGSFTNYGWGKLYDMIFGGVPFTVPSTWYAGLSTTALTRQSTAPAEPTGNGYARAAVSNDTNHWSPNVTSGQPGDTYNGVAVSFPTPTGPWGTLVATAISDASSAGNAWLVAPLTAPVTPGTSTPPTFAVGSLLLGLG